MCVCLPIASSVRIPPYLESTHEHAWRELAKAPILRIASIHAQRLHESDPLLRAALLAAIRLDDLDREAMRAGLRPHGDIKAELNMSAQNVRRA